jgi:dephospho-CoA kinase
MLRVGLTDGIACGKSTVAGMLAKRGAHLLDADRLAHELYAPGLPTYFAVIEHFGHEILNSDGTINRTKLANLVFPQRAAELNAIVHPAVIEVQNKWMAEVESHDSDAVAVVEAALLIEAGAQKDFDKIIVVVCDLPHKLAHFMHRTGASLEEARAEVGRRMAVQLPDEAKVKMADYVVENSDDLTHAEQQVERIWKELVRLSRNKHERPL